MITWANLTQTQTDLQDIGNRIADLQDQIRRWETVRAVIRVTGYSYDAVLESATYRGNGILEIDGLALRWQPAGEMFPDETNKGGVELRSEGLYILFTGNLSGNLTGAGYTHGLRVSQVADLATFVARRLAKAAETAEGKAA